jgi:putative endonuclease
MAMKLYYVYILANCHRTLYTGVTGHLARRLFEHRSRLSAFTARYAINRLVYVESTEDVRAAIRREKEIKGWVRRKKIALIESVNPGWKDLSEGWDR